jgi:hypothetical protein
VGGRALQRAREPHAGVGGSPAKSGLKLDVFIFSYFCLFKLCPESASFAVLFKLVVPTPFQTSVYLCAITDKTHKQQIIQRIIQMLILHKSIAVFFS